MTPRAFRSGLLLVALALLLAGAGGAGNQSAQFSFGGNFFSASPPCPVREFPTFESLVPVPQIIDPFQQDLIPVFCQLFVDKKGSGVNKAKGNYESFLLVRDNDTGEVESTRVAKGKFQTDMSGSAGFDFEIPAELFADGFESGDVSAWSYTRTDFRNGKRATGGTMSCDTGSTSSE